MIFFETITHFRERLQALMDYKRSVYSGAETEIKSAFKGRIPPYLFGVYDRGACGFPRHLPQARTASAVGYS